MGDYPENVMRQAREAVAQLLERENASNVLAGEHDETVSVRAAARAITADRKRRVVVKELEWHEGRNHYWSAQEGYQIALCHDDIWRVRHHGKVVCREIRGFRRASEWANEHNRRRTLAALEWTDEPCLEDDPDALTVAYMAGEAKGKERLAEAEADAERLAEALRDLATACESDFGSVGELTEFDGDSEPVGGGLNEDGSPNPMAVTFGHLRRSVAALAAHEARKGRS